MLFRSSITVGSLGIRTIAAGEAKPYEESETFFYFGGPHEISVKISNRNPNEGDLTSVCQSTGKWEPNSQEIRDAFVALSEGRSPDGNGSLEERKHELDEACTEGRISGYSFPWDVLPPSLQGFINQVTAELNLAAKKSVDALRWRYGILGPYSPFSSGGSEWSFDGEEWHSLPHALQVRMEVVSAGTVHITEEVKADAEALLSARITEPLGHTLFREAWALSSRYPRSALVIGVAALEVGLKQLVSELVPEAEWLMEKVPSPPLQQMLKNYLPKLPAKCTFGGEVLPPPKEIRSLIDDAVQQRNRVAHRTEGAALDYEALKVRLLAIRDVLWLLDYYRGLAWAPTHIREETKQKMEL
jgi:hypothetical protein